ncbi:MAG: acetate kinase [Mariprofundus sp.]|nr:acetate kinase [Mariprofundus sp.]
MILVINSGSSSVKMALIEEKTEKLLAEGLAQKLGEVGALLDWSIAGEAEQVELYAAQHEVAIEKMLAVLFSRVDKKSIIAAGHRVVHGGETFIAPTLLNQAVIGEISALSHLAPLHNPANLLGITAAMRQLSTIPHIAVFDTAFHHAMPSYASMYAVPYEWYSKYGVRRYGFHGSSHHYVGLQAAKILGRNFSDCRLLTAHLGNGCSASAIANGISVDTTMGMTPLEGLVMGTRSGDVDPGLHDFIARQSGMSLSELTSALNRKSGLLGLSGCSNDMRTVLAAADRGDERAALAVEVFCYRLAKALAGLAVALGSVDAIVFTGGIGEHAAVIRAKTVHQLRILGAELDGERNDLHGASAHGFISKKESATAVLVIATNEEQMIARYVCTIVHEQRSN